MKNETAETAAPAGPWPQVQPAVWLLGLAILAWHGWWWPGILVLVAVSIVAKGMVRTLAPPAEADLPAAPAPASAPALSPRPVEMLPDSCARCGGPVYGGEARWTGPRSAACPYCGSLLPLRTH
jgi:hypothetical protein